MERPAFVKATLYDSKAMAEKAMGSPERGDGDEMG